jgi:hypothetical protein
MNNNTPSKISGALAGLCIGITIARHLPGIMVNTNLGGDNAGRGAVLGAMLGAAHGMDKFPDRWIRGLQQPPPDLTGPTNGLSADGGGQHGQRSVNEF